MPVFFGVNISGPRSPTRYDLPDLAVPPSASPKFGPAVPKPVTGSKYHAPPIVAPNGLNKLPNNPINPFDICEAIICAAISKK